MKLNYYSYFLHNTETDKSYRFNLQPLLRHFCDQSTISFKNEFTYNDEHVYLLNLPGNLYTYLMTRSHEVIKKINTSNLTVNEIYDILNADDQIGFASYVYFDSHAGQNFFAQASTFMAPKAKSFLTFVNSLLARIGMSHYMICVEPMLHQATRKEVLAMPFLSKTIMEINHDSPYWKKFAEMANADGSAFTDVGSIEITIKPRRQKNISKAVKQVMNSAGEDGIDKLMIRGKSDLEDNLTDLYIAGKGAVSDTIENGTESEIRESIQKRIDDNDLLKIKLSEKQSKMSYSDGQDIQDINDFNSATTWTNFMGTLPSSDS